MIGNVIQATSRALSEEVTFNKNQVTSLDWITYPILRFADSPKITNVLVQRTDQPSLGSGEPVTCPRSARSPMRSSTQRARACTRHRSTRAACAPRSPQPASANASHAARRPGPGSFRALAFSLCGLDRGLRPLQERRDQERRHDRREQDDRPDRPRDRRRRLVRVQDVGEVRPEDVGETGDRIPAVVVRYTIAV